jgi:predicted hotdog family 3-hydroxylacyl-ACP dehydratase
MKLPHLEPLIFAKKVIKKDENNSVVFCEFKEMPTLTTFIEAAAQSSSSFVDQDKPKLGFLATVKNIEQHKEFDSLQYHIHLKLEAQIAEFKQFYFEVFNLSCDTESYISGNFSVIIKEA